MIKKRNKHFACIISPQDVVQQLENRFNHGDFFIWIITIILYGPLLEDTEWGRPAEPYGDIYHGYDTYTGYYVGEYVGYHNEGLSFVFNKYTNQVVLIRYQRDRHGNSNVLSDVKRI